MAVKPPKDIYSAEKLHTRELHTKALPETAHTAFQRDLSAALASRLEKTVDSIERLDLLVEKCGNKLKRMKRDAMTGLPEADQALIDEGTESPLRDAALVSSAHKAKHYETSTYGTLAAFASHLDHPHAVELLKKTLVEEETASNKKLAGLAAHPAIHETEPTPDEDAASDAPGAAPEAGSAHPL